MATPDFETRHWQTNCQLIIELACVQDRQVQRLMDDLDLPKDRANLFEALDADSSGALHLAELAQGLLKVRGELKMLAWRAVKVGTFGLETMNLWT